MAVIALSATIGYAVVAGSITETKLVPTAFPKWDMHKITLTWVSDVNGNVNGIETTYPLDGEIYRVATIPSTTLPPTDAYDITLLDSDSLDVLQGIGADEPNTVSHQFCPSLASDDSNNISLVAVHGNLTLTVDNAGAAKSGKVIIYWK